MTEIIKLTCPACGGKLEVTEDVERFACSYCGNEHVVIRRGGIVTLKPVVEQLEGVRVATDKTASELALVRLGKEIAQLKDQLSESQPRYTVLGGGVLLLLSTLVCLDLGLDAWCIGVPIFLGILCIVGGVLHYQQANAKYREIGVLLEAKREEYRRHQEIVEER